MDDVVYDCISLLSEKKDAGVIKRELGKTYVQEDIESALMECRQLEEQGMLLPKISIVMPLSILKTARQ